MQYFITVAKFHLSIKMFLSNLELKVLKILKILKLNILSLKTLKGGKSQNTSAIADIQVKRINGNGNWLRLPRFYVRKELLIDKEEIATPAKGITECRSNRFQIFFKIGVFKGFATFSRKQLCWKLLKSMKFCKKVFRLESLQLY